MKMIYKIEMLSDWHCGTGLTEGADIDLICIKDDNGLPIIPGKTLKGLLKEAAMYYKNYTEDKEWEEFLNKGFGMQTKNEKDQQDNQDAGDDRDANQSEQGKFYFSNATLSKNVADKLIEKEQEKNKISTLYRYISSTAIDNKGIAKEHSLRKIEVVVPLTLFAEIDGIENNSEADKLENCFKLVKRLGSNRNRGLGRCILSKLEV